LARAKYDKYPSGTRLQQQIVLLSYEGVIRTRENTIDLHKIFIFLSQITITNSLVVKTYGSSGAEDQKSHIVSNLASSPIVMWDFIVICIIFSLLVDQMKIKVSIPRGWNPI
jgi:hypothetical protein